MPLPDPAAALALIKASVRSQAAYSLEQPVTARKLNQNEAPADIPADLKREILARAAALPWHRYPAFVPTHLTEIIARRHGWVPEGVLVGNGSNEVIQAALAVALGEGDVVVAPSPTFSLYRLLAGVMGARYVGVPFASDFRYDVDALIAEAKRSRARVMVLNSPNNPTGSALPADGVERCLAETGALILCDEAYQDFGGPTAVPLLHRSPRVVVLRTFSKAVGMAGLRFGYALAHPEVAREIAKAKLPYNVNAITLAAAEVAFEHGDVFEARTRAVVAERERFYQAVRGIPGLHAFPSAANFLLLRMDAVPASEVFRRIRDDFGILIRDVSHGAGLAECLRVSIGERADMDAVLEALRAILGGHADAGVGGPARQEGES
ncbi:MAG TPA: histidinol-phosphate transaminase [Gemmatimonadales bacterium]|nr:histidinol-phosphate transaminase [Gemmatimonadales bacterium]